MGKLYDELRRAIEAERVVFSNHADDRLRERSIVAWQVVAGFFSGRLLDEVPTATPNPTIEVEQVLADGTLVKVVCMSPRSTPRRWSPYTTLTGERMQIPGKTITLTKWIHGRACAIRVRVQGVVPDADPSEPCLLPETVRFLDQLQRLADVDDVDSLAGHGDVFVLKRGQGNEERSRVA